MAAPTKTNPTQEQVKSLVTNLDKHECLWNSASQLYHNRDAKVAAWAQLSQVVGLPIADVRRSYESLRTSFRKVSQTEKIIIIDFNV